MFALFENVFAQDLQVSLVDFLFPFGMEDPDSVDSTEEVGAVRQSSIL